MLQVGGTQEREREREEERERDYASCGVSFKRNKTGTVSITKH
jgi:hypothetical protein